MSNPMVSLMQAIGHTDMKGFGDSTAEFPLTAPKQSATQQQEGV